VAFGPLLRSTMMASPIGMVLAASSNQPRTWGHPGGEQDDGDQSRGDVADALDRQVRIGLPAIVPGGNPEACGSRAGRKEKSCADEMMPTAVNPASAYPMSVTSMAFLRPSGTRMTSATVRGPLAGHLLAPQSMAC
jgi:hypothetical protein